MKKILILILALVVALTLAACGNSGNDNSGTAPTGEITPQTPPASGQQQPAGEASAPQKSDGAAVEGMSGRLADAYIEMMSGGAYYVKYRSSQEYDGEKMDAVLEVAVNGEDTALISEMEGGSMHMIVKENKTYIVSHEEKTVMVMQGGSTQQSDGGAFPESGFVFKGDGTAELFDTPLPYEEYSTDGGDVRFFFDGGKLAGFESSAEGLTVQMEILEMSKNIPAGMFDIPAGYEVMEY